MSTEAPAIAVEHKSSPIERLGPLLASTWFLLLAGVYGRSLVPGVRLVSRGEASWLDGAQILSRSCTLVFMLTLAVLMLSRRPAVSPPVRLLPRVTALAGTYGVWLTAFLPAGRQAPSLAAVSAILTLAGSVLIVASIAFLGRSFSIAPQARSLVVAGPYRLVRHPLYLAEEIALLGIALQTAWVFAAPFLLVHLAIQLRRIGYEERLLRSAFAGYDDYARRTARLIPGLW